MNREAIERAYKTQCQVGIPLLLAIGLFELEKGPLLTDDFAAALGRSATSLRPNFKRWKEMGLIQSQEVRTGIKGRNPMEWSLTKKGRKKLDCLKAFVHSDCDNCDGCCVR